MKIKILKSGNYKASENMMSSQEIKNLKIGNYISLGKYGDVHKKNKKFYQIFRGKN
jgi:hypothetical protein